MEDLSFRALYPEFRGTWPARLKIENADYSGTLFYAGTGPDGDREYAKDKAAGTLDRRWLSFRGEPKDPLRMVELVLAAGHVMVSPVGSPACMLPAEAKREAEGLLAAVASAGALEAFLAERFGPAQEPEPPLERKEDMT